MSSTSGGSRKSETYRREAGEDHILLRLPIGRNQAPDRLSNHLASRIAEHSLGRFIPTCDDTVERLADNGIGRRCHDGGEARLRLLGALACSDIANHTDGSDRHPCGIRFHLALILEPTDGPIRHHDAKFKMAMVIRIGTGAAREMLLEPWAVLRMHEGKQHGAGCGGCQFDPEQFARLLRPYQRTAGEVEVPVT